MGLKIIDWTLVALLHILILDQAGCVLLLNPGIHVTQGQSVSVTRDDLQLSTNLAEEACKVEVVLNEPVTQRVGKLTPTVFDCDILTDEVKYVHNGSPFLKEDTVMLRVYRFTDSETFIETVLLRVHINRANSSLVEFGKVPLVVLQFYGLSNIIDSSVLTFRTRPDVTCTVRLLTSETGFPALGQVVKEDPTQKDQGFETASGLRKGRQTAVSCPGNKACDHNTREVHFLKTSCSEFLNSDLKFHHLSPPSPEIDYIPIRVELRDPNTRTLLEVESVWLPVLIHGAMQNQPPHAAFMSMFILEVDQFILTPMTTAALDAKDDETPQARLVFNMTRPPWEGYVTHLSDHTKPISSFTWQDLNEMRIAYQPPNSSHANRRTMEVEFKAMDGFLATSPPIIIHISIRTAETNAPRMSWNLGLDLLEGQSRPITWENLQVVDNDNINAVTLVAVDGPLHGRLSVRGRKGFMFKVKDLHDGVVVYHHSDSDTTSDYIVLRITDGRHSIRHRFPINILPKDDTPPFLINNVAIEVQEESSVMLEDYMLLASDLDSSDDYIQYQLVSFPRAGELIKKSSIKEPGVPVRTFLQRELLQGQIFYKHSGEEVFEDSFDFILSDIHEPPNLSDRHTVVVHVFPVKDQLPLEVRGTVRSITVKETEVVFITQTHLHFKAPEHPDTDLTYFITRSCFSPTKPALPDSGRLFYTDTPKSMRKDAMVPVLRSFTQHAVTHHKVGFMPPIEDIGSDPLFVQFVFSVSDQQGGALTGLIFNITIMPVDDQAPEMFTNPLRVEEGGSTFLMEENLLVQDADTPREKLRVRVWKRPRHGRLELQGVILSEGESFSLQDVKALRVRYTHDDSESTEDRVGLTITDGINSSPGEILVQIFPVNDEPPQLGSDLRPGLSCDEGGRVKITKEYLFATDADSDDNRLTYMLARTPAHGVLQRNRDTVDKFSQLDVLNGLIFYLHTGGEIGTDPISDIITFIVSDGEAGTTDGCCQEDSIPPPVPLHGTLPVYDLNVTVLPVNNQPPSIIKGKLLVVEEGSSQCLCDGELAATDPDTNPDQLLFHLESLPQFGILENTLPSPGFEKSNAGIQVASFTQLHLTSGSINYIQSVHHGVEPTTDLFTISVSDGVHKSEPIPVHIIINPTNDESPSLLLNNFTVMEGGVRNLSPDILNVVDWDSPTDILSLSIQVSPAHGILLNGISEFDIRRFKDVTPELLKRSPPVQSFTMQALIDEMKIMYIHDDSETLEDTFTMQLTDGTHTVQGTTWVRILPVNDEKPRLIKNAGVDLKALERKMISSVVLMVEDQDTPSDQVFYILTASPRFGVLQLKTEAGWTELNTGQNFTEEDVELNRLWYKHTTIDGLKSHDRFQFLISDTEHQTSPEIFFISLQVVERGDITLITNPVTVMEGQRVILTTDIMLATDHGSQSDELIYTVTGLPKHGHLHMVQQPGIPLFSFTQMDVASHKVCYTHDNSHLNQEDSFSFTISNGETTRNGVLSVRVEQSDRIPPTLNINTGLQVTEGTTNTITPEHLQLSDPDTALEKLVYTVIQPPQYGKLLLKGLPLSGPQITQQEINNLQLSYQHLKSFSRTDSFTFQPSDGTNGGYLEYGQLRQHDAVFTIQIEVLDRTPPYLVSKGTPSAVEHLGDNQHAIYITSQDLQASDGGGSDPELEFIITRPPGFGHLENSLTGGYIQRRFTQKDVDQKTVRYVIPSDMEVTADSFEFQVKDPTGNAMAPEIMEVQWSRVELTASCYRVCENSGTLAVRVMRHGNSIDPAYVGIQVEEGTAKLGKDFTHSSADLIQFDPGVNVRLWNIHLKDDRLEENDEILEVVLKAQKNAVLGSIRRASVEIVDPRNGRCDPNDLIVEDSKKIVPHIQDPHPKPLPPAEEEYTPDPNTGVIWEDLPPRGDVPYRTQFISSSGREETKQVVFDQSRRQGLNRHESYSLNPIQKEVISVPRVHPELEIMPIWTWTGHLADSQLMEIPQGDRLTVKFRSAAQQQKSAKPLSLSCYPGWRYFRRFCYLVGPGLVSWNQAYNSCTVLGGHLTSIQSKAHMKWLWRLTGKQAFWIGLSEVQHQWAWTDGTPLTFSKLEKTKDLKSDSSPSCVLARGKKTWTLENCTAPEEHRYVCSAPAQVQK